MKTTNNIIARNSQESVLNINHSTSIRRLKILFLPSKFAFEGAKRIGKRRTAARRWNIAQIFISKSWKLWLELENLKGEFKVKMLMNTVCQFLRERERDTCLFLLSKEAWNLNFVVRIYRAHKRTASCLANQNNDSQFPTIPIFIFVCIGVKVELKEGEGGYCVSIGHFIWFVNNTVVSLNGSAIRKNSYVFYTPWCNPSEW